MTDLIDELMKQWDKDPVKPEPFPKTVKQYYDSLSEEQKVEIDKVLDKDDDHKLLLIYPIDLWELMSPERRGRMPIQYCTLCKCQPVELLYGFPVCEYHKSHGEDDPPCSNCKEKS